eukprot:scaffold19720_cov112-Isochrysis_galbana.AAC.2
MEETRGSVACRTRSALCQSKKSLYVLGPISYKAKAAELLLSVYSGAPSHIAVLLFTHIHPLDRMGRILLLRQHCHTLLHGPILRPYSDTLIHTLPRIQHARTLGAPLLR